jgi:hypothetical protein
MLRVAGLGDGVECAEDVHECVTMLVDDVASQPGTVYGCIIGCATTLYDDTGIVCRAEMLHDVIG